MNCLSPEAFTALKFLIVLSPKRHFLLEEGGGEKSVHPYLNYQSVKKGFLRTEKCSNFSFAI